MSTILIIIDIVNRFPAGVFLFRTLPALFLPNCCCSTQSLGGTKTLLRNVFGSRSLRRRRRRGRRRRRRRAFCCRQRGLRRRFNRLPRRDRRRSGGCLEAARLFVFLTVDSLVAGRSWRRLDGSNAARWGPGRDGEPVIVGRLPAR